MANLIMTNWHIEDNTPYISLGSAGENNAKTINIEVDEIIDNANYYLDIGDENGVELPNTQQLATKTVSTLNGDIIHMLCLKPLVSFLGKEGIKLLQVRCVYTNDNDEEVVKESNVFHAKVDRNSGFVYKYDIAVFEEYLAKIKEGGGCSGYVTEDELIEALRPYATETEVGDAITTALAPYPTTSEVDTAIDTALTPYPTKTEVNNTIDTALTPYAKTSEVSTAISDALVPYSTTSEMNTAINNALTPYSTTSQMNTAISNAVADKQDIIQVDTLPTASVEELGKIYQYIGETIHEPHQDYVHGYFYECKEVSTTPITYAWYNLDVIEMPYPLYQGESSDSIKINNNANVASGASAVAEGHNTTASGQYSHSEGSGTTASSQAAHAEGYNTTAEGYYAHSEGRNTQATQTASHAQNMGTIAQGNSQTTIGKYNIAQGSGVIQDTDYALIIGNGESNSNRSNALAVQWDGTVVMQDNSTIKSAKTVYEVMGKMGAKNLLVYPYRDGNSKESYDILFTANNDTSITVNGTATNWSMFYIQQNILPKGEYILSINNEIIQGVYLQVGKIESGVYTVISSLTYGTLDYKLVLEQDTEIRITIQVKPNTVVDNLTLYPMLRLADDQDSTWQPYAKTNYELTQDMNNLPIRSGEGGKSAIIGDSNNTATGAYGFAGGSGSTSTGNSAVALGISTRATGTASFAEGSNTQATAYAAHAEGQTSYAQGNNSHAEGQHTTASNESAHSEGYHTTAGGMYSHSQNIQTIAQGYAQTAIGKYNVLQGSATNIQPTDYALIIGNGEPNSRSNALAVQWDGNVVFQDGSKQNSASISITDLKTLVASCSDFADFQTQIASL